MLETKTNAYDSVTRNHSNELVIQDTIKKECLFLDKTNTNTLGAIYLYVGLRQPIDVVLI